MGSEHTHRWRLTPSIELYDRTTVEGSCNCGTTKEWPKVVAHSFVGTALKIRECSTCNVTFAAKDPRQKYCKPACRRQFNKKKEKEKAMLRGN